MDMIRIFSCFTYSHAAVIAKRLTLFICLISLSFFIGCTSPKVTLKKENFSADKCKTVYFLAPESKEDDPRDIVPEVISRLEQLGFTVISTNKSGRIPGSQGSGFVIDARGYILTCGHLFEKEKLATVWIKGKRYEADVIKTDADKDMALLKIRGDNLRFRALSIVKAQNYKMGQEVFSIGFPLSDILGNSPRLNKGLISSTVGVKDNPDHLQVSVEAQPGNSGSPLMDSNAYVIGLMQSGLNPLSILLRTGGSLPQNVNFAAKTNLMMDFIKDYREKTQLEPAYVKEMDFEKATEAIVQIRAGNVTDESLKLPKMLCRVYYESLWDIWYRFRVFHIEFYDVDSGDLVLKAGQYRDTVFTTESAVMDRTFEEIKQIFFPNAK